MKLSECTIGTLVIEHLRNRPDQKPRIGHVVGLEENNIGEIIPTVQWAQEWLKLPSRPIGFHHANLDRLVD